MNLGRNGGGGDFSYEAVVLRRHLIASEKIRIDGALAKFEPDGAFRCDSVLSPSWPRKDVTSAAS